MRRFVLVRDRDVSGISGTGPVVWGIEFPDGHCSYRWHSLEATNCQADSIERIMRIHGHEGATRLVWLDTPRQGRIWWHAAGKDFAPRWRGRARRAARHDSGAQAAAGEPGAAAGGGQE